jgi:tRNA G10  N-methylase Trm11
MRSLRLAVETRLFRADATSSPAISSEMVNIRPDIVITDIPYGQKSRWHSDSATLDLTVNPLHQMLESLRPVLSTKTILAIATTKNDRITHERYQPLQKLKLGKRQVVFLKPLPA